MLLHVLLASTAATAPPSQLSSYRVRERGALRPLSPALTKLRGGSGGGLDWRYFVAGSISAGLSHGYTTPIDVVKTRMQTNPELYNGSVALAVRRIVDDEGALFLLQGLGPTLVGYGLEGAIKFGSYEMAKPLFAHVTPSKMVNYLLASCVAGALASTVQRPRGRTTARARTHATRRRTRSTRHPTECPPATAATTTNNNNNRRHHQPPPPRTRRRRRRCSALPRRCASSSWPTPSTRPARSVRCCGCRARRACSRRSRASRRCAPSRCPTRWARAPRPKKGDARGVRPSRANACGLR